MSALLFAILIHVICGLFALISGLILFCKPKHSRLHKHLGYAYALTLTMVDITGLLMHALKGNSINAFHFMAIGNLIALYGGLLAIMLKRPLKHWYRYHYYMISWSYVGLVTATLVEIAIKAAQISSISAIATLCVAAVVGGGLWIEYRTRNFGNVLSTKALGAEMLALPSAG